MPDEERINEEEGFKNSEEPEPKKSENEQERTRPTSTLQPTTLQTSKQKSLQLQETLLQKARKPNKHSLTLSTTALKTNALKRTHKRMKYQHSLKSLRNLNHLRKKMGPA